MKKRILISLFIIHTTFSFGQYSFPVGSINPAWSVLECFFSNCSTSVYQYQYDTSFCGFQYSKINLSFNNKHYIRSDSLRTHFRKTSNCLDKEYLMYNYDLNVGDTTFVGFNQELGTSEDTSLFQLISVDSVLVMNIQRLQYTLIYDRCNLGSMNDTMLWLYGIGSYDHPFFSIKCMCDFCENSYNLLCYDSSNVQLFQNSIFNTCDTILGLPNFSSSENYIHLGANPFINHLKIEIIPSNIAEIKIYDLNGNLVEKQQGLKELYIGSKLKSGIYFMIVTLERNVDSFKIIKI